jgi:uncharacterized protein YndB with AHSA1/START domain
MPEPLIKEVLVQAPVSRVWKAITDKDDMAQWYFKVPEFKAEVGFEFKFYGEDEQRQYPISLKVIEVVPGSKLAYTWNYDDFPGETVVTFELFDQGSGQTLVRLTHTGLEKLAAHPRVSKENHMQGWNMIVGEQLKAFVEKAG